MSRKKMRIFMLTGLGFFVVFSVLFFAFQGEYSRWIRGIFSVLRYGGMFAFIYGGNRLVTICDWEAHPKESRGSLIALKDERNQTIETRAKAKAFELMTYVLLLIAALFVDVKIELLASVLVFAAWIFMMLVYLFCRRRYEREM